MFDPETGQQIPLAPIVLLPSVEGHNMVIAEVSKQNGSLQWNEYLVICSCGHMPQPGAGWHYTKRGATERANRHLEPLQPDPPAVVEFDPFAA